jgi:DnaJ family protein C protein 13
MKLFISCVSLKGVEIQCIGHFKLLFYMLRMDSYPVIEEMALRVLSNVTGSAECVDDIAASRVLAFLVQVIYGLQSQQALALGVLHNLMGDTRLVKECLSNGKTIECYLIHPDSEMCYFP